MLTEYYLYGSFIEAFYYLVFSYTCRNNADFGPAIAFVCSVILSVLTWLIWGYA